MTSFIIGEGSERDRKSIKLATKRGRWIKNVRRMERPPEAMREAERICHTVGERMGQQIKTRSLSGTYNCYGMVFASRRTAIEETEISCILEDDEYVRVANRSDVARGDIVAYRRGERGPIAHVGLIIAVEPDIRSAERRFTVLSQWGFDGEYLHPERCVPPLFGDHIEFYSERKTL